MKKIRTNLALLLMVASLSLVMTNASDGAYNNNALATDFVPAAFASQQQPTAKSGVATQPVGTPAASPSPQSTPSVTPSPQPQNTEDPIEAAKQTYQNHSYPLDTIPVNADPQALDWSRQHVTDAIPDGMDVNAGQTRLSGSITLSSTRMTNLGPQPVLEWIGAHVSGRVDTLAVDPTNSAIVYAGTAGGGVWKTTNCCYTSTVWTPPNDSTYPLSATAEIGALVIDPNNHNTIYAGTGGGLVLQRWLPGQPRCA